MNNKLNSKTESTIFDLTILKSNTEPKTKLFLSFIDEQFERIQLFLSNTIDSLDTMYLSLFDNSQEILKTDDEFLF